MFDRFQYPQKMIGRGLALLIFILSASCFCKTMYDLSYGLDDIVLGVKLITLYYTHIVTAATAAVFLAVVLFWPRFSSANVIGHVVVSLTILIAHYWFFMGWEDFVSSPIRSKIAHGLLPFLVFVFWIFFADKRELTWRSPLAWTAFAITYTGYALLRGAITGEYAYGVGNVTNLGYAKVLSLVALTTVLSVFFGYGLLFASRAPRSLLQPLAQSMFARINPEYQPM